MPFILANILQPLIDVFDGVIVFFHDSVGLSWGLSIIALTLAVRLLLLPLTLKQAKSMQRMARVMPQIKELQAKYKGDKQRLNEETMKFYRENKVNPFGSCLPLAAQLPVFFSLFYMLRQDLRVDICGQTAKPCSDIAGSTGAEQFLFVPDITDHATGAVLVLLIVLYVGSQLLSTVLMSVTTDRSQRMIFIALPFVFIPFVLNFPAGLLIYWITTNLWTVGQQAFVRRTVGPIKPPELPALGASGKGSGGATAAGAPAGNGGGLMARLSEAVAAARPASDGTGSGSGSVVNGASARAGAGAEPVAGPRVAPPPPPRRKKKRSGRRR
jgi:YidC/Oxa1 family membrane protein insertase